MSVVQQPVSTDTAIAFDVELKDVLKQFGSYTAVQDINLAIQQGEFFSILGPSGCGKTTMLRLIAGFEMPTAGEVRICGQVMASVPSRSTPGKKVVPASQRPTSSVFQRVPPFRRPVNTVFQSYALFGHMSVQDNVAFGLQIKRMKRAEIQDRVREALQLVQMESFAKRYPKQLSGGQQQRVALARALVNRPAVVLLDEPLGALDLKLRKEMQFELSKLHQQLGITFVMVTHDQEEALSLSDRIAVMNVGRMEQLGTPTEIYNRPKTAFVADFIGDTNLFLGKVEERDASSLNVKTGSGLQLIIGFQALDQSLQPGQDVTVSVRPEVMRLTNAADTGALNCFEGKLQTTMYLGTHVYCVVELTTGDRLTVRQSSGFSLPSADESIYVSWAPADGIALAQQSHV